MYHAGKMVTGIYPSKRKAEKYFRLAAEQGHVQAQTNLGFIIQQTPNPTAAAEWCEKCERRVLLLWKR